MFKCCSVGNKPLVAIAVACAVLFLTHLAVFAENDPIYGGTLSIAINREPDVISPHIYAGSTTQTLQGNVYDSLISYDLDGKLAPGLAEEWDILDPITYIFHLRRDVVFHDGSPFTAEDVIYSYELILDETRGASRRSDFQRIESVEAIDEHTIKIVLKEPFAPFLGILAANDAGIISKDWVEAGGDLAQNMMGTGPFMLKSYEPGVSYTLVKNPSYWESNLPYLDQLEIIPIPDVRARVSALISRDVQFAEYIPWESVFEIEANPELKYYLGNDALNWFRFNVSRSPLDDPRVRKALNHALDRQAVSELAYGGYAVPATVGFLHPGTRFFNDELDGYWSYDPIKAKALLAEAGYDNPADLKFEIVSYRPPHHLNVAEVAAAQWREIGITIENIRLQEISGLLERRASGDYIVMVDGNSWPTDDPIFLDDWFRTNAVQFARAVGYSNPKIDQLLDLASKTVDETERKSLYKQVEELLLEDAPVAPVVWRPQIEATVNNLRGYYRPGGYGPDSPVYMQFKTVWLDR